MLFQPKSFMKKSRCNKEKIKSHPVQYTKVLADLLERGDQMLANFTTKNASLLEKLEYLLLRLEISDPDQHAKV